MRPASSPFCSCSEPSVAEICSWLWTSNVSGSAPKFSWLASSVAVARVKVPEISALPSEMTTPGANDGAEMTSPSSTIANWFCGGVSPCRRVVTSRNTGRPTRVNSMFATHSLVTAPVDVLRSPDEARAISSPWISTGPRMYLAEPSSPQVTSASSSGPLSPPVRFFGSAQSSALAWASTASVT